MIQLMIELGLEMPLSSGSVVLANDTKIDAEGNLIGGSNETAFIQYALTRAMMLKILEQYPRVVELPFNPDRKLINNVHPLPDGKFVAVKGAPDLQLLKRCVAS